MARKKADNRWYGFGLLVGIFLIIISVRLLPPEKIYDVSCFIESWPPPPQEWADANCPRMATLVDYLPLIISIIIGLLLFVYSLYHLKNHFMKIGLTGIILGIIVIVSALIFTQYPIYISEYPEVPIVKYQFTEMTNMVIIAGIIIVLFSILLMLYSKISKER